MNPLIILLITAVTEHIVVYLHGIGVRIAFGVGFFLQLAYAVWGFMIGDVLFGVTGVTLALLNLHFHFKGSEKHRFRRGVEIDDVNLWSNKL